MVSWANIPAVFQWGPGDFVRSGNGKLKLVAEMISLSDNFDPLIQGKEKEAQKKGTWR